MQMKYGVYADYGMNKEKLQDLILFSSSNDHKLVTLDEYVTGMREEQKYIYYATGESIARIEQLPQTELVKDNGFEILYLTDSVDEFAIKIIGKYKDKEFKNVSADDLGLETPEKKEELKAKEEESADMLEELKNALDGKVTKDFPVTGLLEKAKPVLTTLPGWKCDITGITEYNKLPENCRKYIEFIEQEIGFKIHMVSNGPARENIIIKE